MGILFALVGFLVSLPLTIGVWVTAVKLFKFVRERSSGQTAFIVTLCVLAAMVSLASAPAYLLGIKGFLLTTAIGVFFVGMGAKHTWRVFTFLKRELDTDPNNDVPIDNSSARKGDGTDDSK